MDEKIAEDDIENNPYTDETRWMLKKSLYYKLDDNNELLSDSLMNAFYYEMQSTSIPDFKTVDDGKKSLAESDSSLGQLLQYHSDLIQLKNDLSLAQMEILVAGIENGSLNYTALNTIESLQVAISTSMNESDSLVSLAEINRVALVTSVESANNQVATATTIESNEKDVNSIYLATIARGIFSFTPSQSATLTAIANQCPLSGGKGVFRARSMLALTGETKRYNDRVICGDAGIQLRQQQLSNTGNRNVVKLYPNPANELVTVEYQFFIEDTYRMHLFNTLGKQQGTIALEGLQGSTTFSTSQLPPGLYYYRIMTRNGIYDTGKLIIVR